jgi:hypothetical protein
MSKAASGRNRPVVKAVYLGVDLPPIWFTTRDVDNLQRLVRDDGTIDPAVANDDGTFVLLSALADTPYLVENGMTRLVRLGSDHRASGADGAAPVLDFSSLSEEHRMGIGQLPGASAAAAGSMSIGGRFPQKSNVVSVPHLTDSPHLTRTGKYVFTTLTSDPLELQIHRDRTVESKYKLKVSCFE